MKSFFFAVLLCTSACLGPQVSDDVVSGGLLLPAGSPVPRLEDDPELAAQLDDNDGVDGLIPRLSAFAGGQRVWYWELGPAPDLLQPVYEVVVRNPDGDLIPIEEHLQIVGSIPGDPGYSPFWVKALLEVTDAYDGELLTSTAAIDEAVRQGLVLPPKFMGYAVDCPVVASDSRLEVGGGNEDEPPGELYYQGMRVPYYDFGPMPIESRSLPTTMRLLHLAREGQAPLSEPVRGVDMTGDGDIVDTNDLFEVPISSEAATPAVRVVDVQIAPAVTSIDTSGDETVAQLTAVTDVFDPDPVAGIVVAYDDPGALHNCPQQREVGAR